MRYQGVQVCVLLRLKETFGIKNSFFVQKCTGTVHLLEIVELATYYQVVQQDWYQYPENYPQNEIGRNARE